MRASLPAEVAVFLRAHAPATASEVALGVRARRVDVDVVLSRAPFTRVARPEGASPRAAYFGVSGRVLGGRGGRSRAELLGGILADGRRHTRDEIFRLAGRVFLTNNAAAELRRRGHDVRYDRDGDVYWIVPRESAVAA